MGTRPLLFWPGVGLHPFRLTQGHSAFSHLPQMGSAQHSTGLAGSFFSHSQCKAVTLKSRMWKRASSKFPQTQHWRGDTIRRTKITFPGAASRSLFCIVPRSGWNFLARKQLRVDGSRTSGQLFWDDDLGERQDGTFHPGLPPRSYQRPRPGAKSKLWHGASEGSRL